MSVCNFIAADIPLQEMSPAKDYPVHIDIDNGIIDDGGADDNFFLLSFPDVQDYTDKKYGVHNRYSCLSKKLNYPKQQRRR